MSQAQHDEALPPHAYAMVVEDRECVVMPASEYPGLMGECEQGDDRAVALLDSSVGGDTPPGVAAVDVETHQRRGVWFSDGDVAYDTGWIPPLTRPQRAARQIDYWVSLLLTRENGLTPNRSQRAAAIGCTSQNWYNYLRAYRTPSRKSLARWIASWNDGVATERGLPRLEMLDLCVRLESK